MVSDTLCTGVYGISNNHLHTVTVIQIGDTGDEFIV